MSKKIPDEHEQLEFSWSAHDQIEFSYDDPDVQASQPQGKSRRQTAGMALGIICALALSVGGFFLGRLTAGSDSHETFAENTQSTNAVQGEGSAQAPVREGYDALAKWFAEQLSDKGNVKLFEGNGEYSFDEIIVGDFDGDGLFPEAVRLHIGPNEQGEMTDSVNVTFWELDGNNTLRENTISQAFTKLSQWKSEYEGTQGEQELLDNEGQPYVCRTFISTIIFNQRNPYSGVDIILSGEQYFEGIQSPYSFFVHYENGAATRLYGVKGLPRAEYRTNTAGEKDVYYDHDGTYQFYAPYPEQTELTQVYRYSYQEGISGKAYYNMYAYAMLEEKEYYLKRPVLAKAAIYDDQYITLTGTMAKFIGALNDYYLIETDTGMMGYVQITSGAENSGFADVVFQDLPFRDVFSENLPAEEE